MSNFGFSSTADEVLAGVDLSGRTAFITGGYSGLGRETARAMADRGAHVILSGRDATKLAAAKIAFGAGCATAITLGERPRPLHPERPQARAGERGRERGRPAGTAFKGGWHNPPLGGGSRQRRGFQTPRSSRRRGTAGTHWGEW